jgi:uncharacterized membrane protein YkvI
MSAGRHHRLLALLVPAGVFQSVIVGGAYGTGREVAEYLTAYGPLGGLLAIGAVMLGFALLLAVSFEFARVHRVYDYRNFIRGLLGRWWWSYEICFLLLLVIVLAVTGAAAGTVLADTFGIAPARGTLLMLCAVVVCNFFGRRLVEATLTVGALALSIGLLAFGWLVLGEAGGAVGATLARGGVEPGWLRSAGQFVLYNSALVPVLLYATSDLRTRTETLGAACIAALAGVLPALVLHLCFLARWPSVIEQAIPAYWMIGQFGTPQFLWVYVGLLFVTIVQTGVGVLQGVNERLDAWYAESRARVLPKWAHAAVAGAAVALSLLLSRAGIVDLIARGYGTLAWCFLVVFTLPVLTIGVARIRAGSPARSQ